ncbi:MAG: ribbon-helix-helix domain-containing protein [Hyphomicrobiaceae bacterium]
MSENLRPQKRSFSIRGHRTSLSLETTFWNALNRAAQEDGIAVAALVTRIDANRGRVGLSSAIRVYLFDRFCIQSNSSDDPAA